MPRISLHTKVALPAVLAIAAVASVTDWYYLRQLGGRAHEALTQRAFAVATALVSECEQGLLVGDRSLLHHAAHRALAQQDVLATAVFNAQGKLLALAGAAPVQSLAREGPDLVMRVTEQASELLAEPLPAGSLRVCVPVFFERPDAPEIDEPALARITGERLGLVVVHVNRARTVATVADARRVGGGLVAIFALIAIGLCLRVVRHVVQPVETLVAGTELLAGGRLDARVPVRNNDEIGDLARAFNTMAAALEKSAAEIARHQTGLERRIAEATAELRESEQRFRMFMDNSPTIAWLKDDQRRYVYLSKPFENQFGIRLDDWRGKTDFEVWPKAIAEQFLKNDQTVLADGQAIEVVEQTIDAKGMHRYWWTFKFSLLDAAGRQYVGGIGVDVTERRRLEDRLRQAQKMEAIGQLAGGVAHDFNNILTAVMGFADLLSLRTDLPAPARRYVEQIQNSAKRAAALTAQLLAFARRQTLQPQVIDLNCVIQGMDKMLRRIIREDIRLTMVLAPDLAAVKADQHQFEQVLMNLCVNAHDAMPHGGDLTITTRNMVLDADFVRQHSEVQPGRYVLVAVRDTGTGMTPEVQAHLFEPFFTTKGLARGTGLGLATAYGIVRQSDGYIIVASEPNRETTFNVYLPQTAELPVAPPTPQMARQLAGGTETVLVVEDEPATREMAVQILRDLGYTVIEASDGLAAVADSECHPDRAVDLLLTDIIMPGLNGQEVALRLTRRYPKLRVLYVSGYAETEIWQHGAQGNGEFLPKPFTASVLAEKVRQVLALPPPA